MNVMILHLKETFVMKPVITVLISLDIGNAYKEDWWWLKLELFTLRVR